MLHTFLRRVCAALALCIVLTVPAILLTGCGGRSAESPVPTQQTPARSMEERRASLGPYMEAMTAYNSTMLPLSLAVSTTVSDLRQGKHLTSIILPPLSKLRRELDAAHAAPGGTGVYPDVDAATEELRSTLEELAPLADQMENYYAAGAYTADGYAQADEMTAQFLLIQMPMADFLIAVQQHRTGGKQNLSVFFGIDIDGRRDKNRNTTEQIG